MSQIFRFYSNPDINRVSVVGQYTNGILNIAVARCSCKEHFIRKKGRTIAEGRLNKGKYYKSIPMQEFTSSKFVAIAKEIANEVLLTKKVY